MAIKKCILGKKTEGEKGAKLIVEEAKKYKGEIVITKEKKMANAKSILGILSLGLKEGDNVIVDVYEDIENDSKVLDSFLDSIL